MCKNLYGFAKLLKPLIRPFYPVTVFGPKKFEDKKTIFVMNHNSGWDPVVWSAYCKNQIHFMYKAEFRKNGFLRSVFNSLEYVPVSRGDVDLAAIKKSLEILNGEKILGIFPEGTRSPDPENFKPFHTGTALLALKTKAPIRLFYIWDKLKMFHRNYIVVGEEYTLEKYYDRKITKDLLEEISRDLCEKLVELKTSTDKYIASKGKKRRKLTKKEQKKLDNFRKSLAEKIENDKG